MDAKIIYEKLEKDFINTDLWDEWADYMEDVKSYLCKNFLSRSMGLVCDFTSDINKVYTAVFPTKKVMKKILDDNISNAMLFVHHPAIWDISDSRVFYQMSQDLLREFKIKGISIYNLHVPLDNYSEYSTSKTLADKLEICIERKFAKYNGALCGVIGNTSCNTVEELKKQATIAFGHEVGAYLYGDNKILNNKVAIVAGGGNKKEFVKEMINYKVNTFITGITNKNMGYNLAHNLEEEHRINVIGGTHYTTEKYACLAMCKYFDKLGLNSQFVEGEAILEDL